MTPAETLEACLTRWPPQACVESAAREVIAENALMRGTLIQIAPILAERGYKDDEAWAAYSWVIRALGVTFAPGENR